MEIDQFEIEFLPTTEDTDSSNVFETVLFLSLFIFAVADVLIFLFCFIGCYHCFLCQQQPQTLQQPPPLLIFIDSNGTSAQIQRTITQQPTSQSLNSIKSQQT